MELSESKKDFINLIHKRLKKREFLEYKKIKHKDFIRAYIWDRNEIWLYIKEKGTPIGVGKRIELSIENLSRMSEEELEQIWTECLS